MSSYSDSEDYVCFESVEHGKSVLAGIKNLWEMQQLFDVTLVAEDREFPAHRVVLASCSDYFRAMFTDGLRECTQSHIHLMGLTATSMKQLINFAYNSTIHIDSDNVCDVLAGATHVQILPVIKACENYLIDHLTLDNCITVANIAELYFLKLLYQQVLNFMCRNWSTFSTFSTFQELTPEFLLMLLSSGYPVDCSEARVLASVLNWFSYSSTTRSSHMTDVVQHILFENMAGSEFSIVAKSKEWLLLLDSCPEILDRVPKIAKFLNLLEDTDTIINVTNYSSCLKSPLSVTRIEIRQPVPQLFHSFKVPGLINSRGYHACLVVAGGFRKESGMTNNVLFLDSFTGSLRPLTKIPHLDQINFGMTVFKNHLYIVGGCFNDHMQEIAHPFGFCYSPVTNKWASIAPMLQERCRFLLCSTSDRIYAIGGDPHASEMNSEDGALCEVYNPKYNNWKAIALLPGNRSQLAGTSLGRCILVSGGILENDEKVFQDFHQYDPRTDSWQRKADLLTPRTDHYMFVWNGDVYVIGGWHLDPISKRRLMATTIDRYDFATDSWEEVGLLNIVRTYGTYTLSRDSIFAIGGWYDGDHARKCHIIDTFNLRHRTWVQSREQKVALWEHSTCSLYLPKCVPSSPK